MVSPTRPDRQQPGSFEDLKQAVVDANGLYRTTMGALRELYGVGRLGAHVVTLISQTLAVHGIAHLPEELPAAQFREVRLYLKDSTLGHLIAAVLAPSPAGDEVLRLVGDHDSAIGRLHAAADLAMRFIDVVTAPGRPTSG